MSRGKPAIDMTGQRFGRLVVLARAAATPGGSATWLCQCDCGQTKTVVRTCLLTGDTQSCGCLRSETTAACSADRAGHRRGVPKGKP
jgi:hypothetical protein